MVDRSSDTAQSGTDWRDKYLNALDTQEAIEQQREFLRRLLVRVSVAADGQDEVLDSVLDRLRNQLRARGDADLQQLFGQVDQAVINFERQRDATTDQVCQGLITLLRPFRDHHLPRVLRKEIEHYAAQLPKRSEKVHLYPALLQQLAELQRQVFAEIQQPPTTGFLQKLFGTSASNNALPVADESISPESLSSESASLSHQLAGSEADRLSDGVTPADKPVPVIDAVSQTLGDLLDKVDVPENIRADVDIIRQRLAQGLTTENLAPTLEHVRDVIIQAYLNASQAFATYLKNINQELMDIYGVLGGAVQHHADQRQVTQHLQTSMMQQVVDLESHVATATDLNQLKEQVKSQLGHIRQALDSFQQSENQQQALAGQLQTLAARIKAMEEDAERNRTTMEKHRYKSLHDPLTELPNREAYNERVDAEWQRWQRYGSPLTLAVCDLDHFKKINDSFGHQAGDRVLKVISRSIAKRLREVDFFGRYGGEEFVVIMPETALDKAVAVLEKIRSAIANTAFNYKEEPLIITLSMGITEFIPGDTVESAFARADRALYTAKAEGRNRCQVAEP